LTSRFGESGKLIFTALINPCKQHP